jgi:signal transduction histidine kinase
MPADTGIRILELETALEAMIRLNRALLNVDNPEELAENLHTHCFGGSASQVALYLFVRSAGQAYTLVPYSSAPTLPANRLAHWAQLYEDSLQKTRIVEPRLFYAAPHALHPILSDAGASALAIIPLTLDAHKMGVLIFVWQSPYAFSAHERELLYTLPGLVVPVIEKLRLIDSLDDMLDDITAAHELSQEANRLKSEFLAMISHELRTPLNAVNGYTGLMLMGAGGFTVDGKLRHYLQRVQSSATRLTHIIEDLLDFTHLNAEQTPITLRSCSIRAVASSWVEQAQGTAMEKGVTLALELHPELPERILLDEQQLTRAMRHLINNALKFTHQGSVTVYVQADEHALHVCVDDSGIGIPQHAHEYIFEPFRMVDGSSTRTAGGTGMGLAIVKKVVHAMGGEIGLESIVDTGSRFTVILPLQTSHT